VVIHDAARLSDMLLHHAESWFASKRPPVNVVQAMVPHTGPTSNDQIQNAIAKESTKPAVSRLDWRKYEQKSVS
jgi:hypothetical protein